MMVGRNQHGFTLIEITLVMAISAGLLTAVLVGQAQTRSRAQFSAAVNQVVSDINNVEDETQSGVQNSSGVTGTNTTETFFGKLMTFTTAAPGNGAIQVTDLYNNSGALAPQPTYSLSIPWGVTVASVGPTNYLVFHLASANAKLLTYTDLTTAPTLLTSYYETPPPNNMQIGTLTLTLTDPRGHTANISVDGTTGGTVMVTYP